MTDLEFLTEEQKDELFSENNAIRISRLEELFGPSLDANQIENFDILLDKRVLGKDGKILGFKSELPK